MFSTYIHNKMFHITHVVKNKFMYRSLNYTKKKFNESKEKLLKNENKSNILPSSFKKDFRLDGFLEWNPSICSGCGTPFQSKAENAPGYLQKDKLIEYNKNMMKIRLKQDAIKILQIAGISLNSTAAETVLKAGKISQEIINEILSFRVTFNTVNGEIPLQSESESQSQSQLTRDESNERYKSDIIQNRKDFLINRPNENITEPIIDKSNDSIHNDHAEIGSLILDPNYQAKRPEPDIDQRGLENHSLACVCQRCFRLQAYGQLQDGLRPGFKGPSRPSHVPPVPGARPPVLPSNNDLLSPDRFVSLLTTIRSTSCVVLCLLDAVDLHGSVLANLVDIAGENRIVVVANKIDLLPKDMSHDRIKLYIYSEVRRRCNMLQGQGLRREDVHLVSCRSGEGIERLMRNTVDMANSNGKKVYVVGAANSGKSSFLNYVLLPSPAATEWGRPSRRVAAPLLTVSPLPGTTLDFVRIQLPGGVTLVDTPGVLSESCLTSRLTLKELKQCLPTRQLAPPTLRLELGKCVLLGGLGWIELVEGASFNVTFFVSRDVVLHPTAAATAEDFVIRHGGALLNPPDSPERMAELGPFEYTEFEIEGAGWERAAADVAVAGLGWMAVTGVGRCVLRVRLPRGVAVGVRPPLLPFDNRSGGVRFTGGRLARK